MLISNTFRTWLHRQIKERFRTVAAFDRATGIAGPTWHRILAGKSRKLDWDTFVVIADVFGLDHTELFQLVTGQKQQKHLVVREVLAKPEREMCLWLQANPEISKLIRALLEKMGFQSVTTRRRKRALSKSKTTYARKSNRRPGK